ncbi:hypothetical protein B0H19DRAFT_1057245 [Mycena capillaripes]|nr:hypothetical protein B0H19DRAFT_1057245 [Mycena capillaripes]
MLVAAMEAHLPPVTLSLANLVQYRTIEYERKHELAHERIWFAAARLIVWRRPGDATCLSKTQTAVLERSNVRTGEVPSAEYSGFGDESHAEATHYILNPGGGDASRLRPRKGMGGNRRGVFSRFRYFCYYSGGGDIAPAL